MKYSFIIPAYNCADTLEATVQSIIECSLEEYEVIIVNDGSTDDTEKICRKLCLKEKRIQYHYQENRGVSCARNIGLWKSTGDYILFVDSDDTLDSTKMKEIIEVVEVNDHVDMIVYGMSFDYYYKGSCYRKEPLLPPYEGMKEKDVWMADLTELYHANSLSSLCNKIIRRDIIQEYQLTLNESMFLYEDLEFVIRCLGHVNEIYFSKKDIYHYKQAEDQGNAGRRLKRIAHINTLIEELELSWSDMISNSHPADRKAVEESSAQILLHLYLTLAREKSEKSSFHQKKIICQDFKNWSQKRKQNVNLKVNDKFAKMLIGQRVCQIWLYHLYIKVRHSVAVKMKSMGLIKAAR